LIASGQVTFGRPRAHLTLSAGYPFVLADADDDIGAKLVSLSGNVRMSKHVALVASIAPWT